jgi:hypothetical protein
MEAWLANERPAPVFDGTLAGLIDRYSSGRIEHSTAGEGCDDDRPVKICSERSGTRAPKPNHLQGGRGAGRPFNHNNSAMIAESGSLRL